MRKETNEKQTSVQKGVESCREKIINMVNQIDDEKFLKRIYISLRDYIREE